MMMKKVELPFCDLVFKETHTILEMKPSSKVTVEVGEEITALLSEYYQDRRFVLITHRKHFHEIDLDVYKGKILKNMVGFAIVSDNPKEIERAMEEQALWNEAFTFFKELEDAENWASSFFD